MLIFHRLSQAKADRIENARERASRENFSLASKPGVNAGPNTAGAAKERERPSHFPDSICARQREESQRPRYRRMLFSR
jgi:hypothetical protein